MPVPSSKDAAGADALAGKPVPVAAIDVGSNSIRMCVAELLPDGGVRRLETLSQPVRLGLDTFRRGRIGGAALQAACDALAGFRRAMDTYGVAAYRAVATSAVREAANCDAFLDRVAVTTGLRVENVEGIEESRLTYQMVRRLLAGRYGFADDNSMILSLGSGSAEITALEAGRVLFSETRRIGTLRLPEMLDVQSEKRGRGLMAVFLDDVAVSLKRLHPETQLRRLLVISPDLLRVADELAESTAPAAPAAPSAGAESAAANNGGGRGPQHPNLHPHPPGRHQAHVHARARNRRASHGPVTLIPRARFDAFLRELERTDPADRHERFGLGLDEGGTILPAALTVRAFWSAIDAAEAVLLDVSMLDCLLLDFSLRGVTPGEGGAISAGCPVAASDEDFRGQVLGAAVGLGRRYRFDEPHAQHVRGLCRQLFDQLSALHGLGDRERLLLEVSAVLHDIGLFVSPTSHHKHSMYLIRNSELLGLDRDDLNIVSVIARYHRRSGPRTQHAEFSGLPRKTQMTVSKLAALLRMAEALDRSHARSIRRLEARVNGSELLLDAYTPDDLSLERWSLKQKSDVFESLFGLSVRLRARAEAGA
jgi:exopolyphosphatase/guanosine-5'-triphosphate,3'-diphosphate pyrophosphatase